MNTLMRGIPHEVYHADPWGPSLSRSIAFLLISKSPLHAHAAHPRLGNTAEEKFSDCMDAGSLLHDLLLGGGAPIEVIDAPDYRKKYAQQARDAARAEGKTPVLYQVYEDTLAAATAIRRQLEEFDIPLAECEREVVALWTEGGVLCRARLDLLHLGRGIIYDIKFKIDAHPRTFGRSMVGAGLDIQHATYTSAIEHIHPELSGRMELEFLLCERAKPYAVSRVALGGGMRGLGRSRWERALRTWRTCLTTNHWPGYGSHVVEEPPTWALEEDFQAAVASYQEPAWISGEEGV